MTAEQLNELADALLVLSAKSSVLKERDELRALMKENLNAAEDEEERRRWLFANEAENQGKSARTMMERMGASLGSEGEQRDAIEESSPLRRWGGGVGQQGTHRPASR